MEQQPNFTDGEIKVVNKVIRQAMQVLLEQSAMNNLANTAKRSGDPAKAIAGAVLPVIRHVYAAAHQAGGQLDIRVLTLAGREIIKVLVAVLGASGVIHPEQATQVVSQAYQATIDGHNAAAGG
jgi:hypothetical protein